jgi:hypothetical protein
MINGSVREVIGVMLLGEANREAPVRTEPHPTGSFAGASRFNLPLTSAPSQ